MRKIYFLALLLFCQITLFAQDQGAVHKFFDRGVPERQNKEFQFLAYFFSQAVNNNMYPENDFLKGQIVGRLFGQNTTKTSDTLRSFYVEQRILPFFIYQPRLFNGKAILRASFELDWSWGDVAYGVGGNFGGGFSADQVNLQTQNVELELIPWKGWAINVGLMRLFDSPYNPYRTYFDKMTNTGYRLAYWGSDAAGISVRRDYDYNMWKAGFYQLYENNIEQDDDVTLAEFSYQHSLSPKWNLGASAYWLRDRSNGEGGPSILGQGLTSILASYNGVYRFPLGADPYRADVVWLGGFFGRNEDLYWDQWSITGFVNANLGTIRQVNAGEWRKTVDIAGLAANLKTVWRHGQTPQDAVTLDLIYASGDDGISDGTYSGVLTGNNWGSPGAIFISHGSYLLFPHGNVVNRFVSAVNDISNNGYGISAATLSVSKAFIPNRWYAKAGMASGLSNVELNNGGVVIGTELNGMTGLQLGPFMNVELHGAWLNLGDFYDSPVVNGGEQERPVNPWTAFMVFKWLMF
ncbi:MAG: hypothetical protein KA479_04065 [Saprospiraceae bacterium]|nr:hypothetical protein [Saprospiraceae bacterium]